MGVAVRVCEGGETVPDSTKLGNVIAQAMKENSPQKVRAKKLRDEAIAAVNNGGSSSRALDGLVKELVNMSMMEKLSVVFCCIFLLLSCLSPMLVKSVKSSPPTPWPGLYAFGDSMVDTGNDYFPGMTTTANYSPYEIDFPTGLYCLDCGARPFGRARLHALRNKFEAFTDYVTRFLPKSIDERSEHLSKSIFLVHIGSDDYLYNYLQKDSINNKYSARQFGKLLVEKLGNHLKHLYHVGARKIVVFEIPPLGCLPRQQVDYIPAPNTGGCTRSTNNLVHHFNKQLPGLLNSLSRSLKGVTFVTAKTYGLFLDMASNPNKYGLTDTRNPCCILASSGSGLCEPYQKPCDNRNSHLFWDSINPTEVVHKLIAEKCYKGIRLVCANKYFKSCHVVNLRLIWN
ncbi:GDSL esterase/lipase [Quillaja saponaria]|uniref:GDSL esterase/lipase n=1 Tax=Quillaja saponaria TaxID=32244 RepID=A0AAD7PGE3_QUISA|nr:GDSL esterase/lipase [Quillaja saponaria]